MKITNFLLAVCLLATTVIAQAVEEVAGKVGYMSGTLVAQRADGTIKVLASKSDVLAGDMLITSKESFAQIQMNDGSKMTLRPNSNLRIEAFRFVKEVPESDNFVLRLLKGGFRTVTGLIGKRGNADSYRLNASTATIGIRGTDFSSRLCASKNCQDDEADKGKQAANTPVNQSQVIGRVMLAQGDFTAKDAAGKMRKLTLGTPVYEGDELSTGKGGQAVVAFRDESRVSLQENTVFYVEKFKYDKVATQENAMLRLLKGGVRVVTGLIGRVSHENYQLRVATATIGIRGTGFDAWCHGPCAGGAENPGATETNPLDGAGVFVWAGEVALVTDCATVGSCPTQVVGLQQAAIIARDSGTPIRLHTVPSSIINNETPRPDSVPVDMQKLFGTESNDGEPGLYVTVHDGSVIVSEGGRTLDLGRGETGFSNQSILARLAVTPSFLGGDSQQINPSGRGANSPNPSLNPSGCAVQ